MTKICTDLEQSLKLVELGLDPYTSDMYWLRVVGDTYDFEDNVISLTESVCQLNVEDESMPFHRTSFNEDDTVPAWSLSALLELIPITCDVIKDFHNCYYCSNKFDDNSFDTWHLTTSCKTSIDAAFEMVVWLLENGYIKPIK